MNIIEKIKAELQQNPIEKEELNQAAILIPIININNTPQLLFQVRSQKLIKQPGDICFPGGHIEKGDTTPIMTAIRETSEELGIMESDIHIYGQLPAFTSSLGYQIYPIIGEITSLDNLNINKEEVEEIFMVPINWLLNHKPITSQMQTAHKPASNFPFELLPNISPNWQKTSEHTLYFYHYKKYVIWGLTAYIVQSFLNLIID